MKDKMIALLKKGCENQDKFNSIESIYTLYETLQFCENLNEMAQSIYEWLEGTYNIDNLELSLFDLEHNTSTTILKKGGDFFRW